MARLTSHSGPPDATREDVLDALLHQGFHADVYSRMIRASRTALTPLQYGHLARKFDD